MNLLLLKSRQSDCRSPQCVAYDSINPSGVYNNGDGDDDDKGDSDKDHNDDSSGDGMPVLVLAGWLVEITPPWKITI